MTDCSCETKPILHQGSHRSQLQQCAHSAPSSARDTAWGQGKWLAGRHGEPSPSRRARL